MKSRAKATHRKELIMAITMMTESEIKSVTSQFKKSFGEIEDCIWIVNHYFPIMRNTTQNTQDKVE